MSPWTTNYENLNPRCRGITQVLLSLIFLWAFVGAIDGPWVQFHPHPAYVIGHASKAVSGKQGIETGPLSVEPYPDLPMRVHASFLLFDFKQNLRRWPNVASDISRSPPSFRTA